MAEELHFRRAAERLHIAQPSLSAQIRQLERRLGVRLLIRSTRMVTLTPAGETLLRQGRQLLAHAERVALATRHAAAEILTVGFYGSAAINLMPDVLRAFAEGHPATQVTLRELPFGRVAELIGPWVDVAFTRLLPDQLDPHLAGAVLGHELRLAALPATHPLAGRGTIRFDELRAESFIVNPALKGQPPARWLAEQHRHGLSGLIAAEASSVEELLTLVASGRGVTLVPASVAEHYPRAAIRYVPVSDAEPAVISIVWRRASGNPTLFAFIDSASAVAADSAEPRATHQPVVPGAPLNGPTTSALIHPP